MSIWASWDDIPALTYRRSHQTGRPGRTARTQDRSVVWAVVR